jgi:hypothetical protein
MGKVKQCFKNNDNNNNNKNNNSRPKQSTDLIIIQLNSILVYLDAKLNSLKANYKVNNNNNIVVMPHIPVGSYVFSNIDFERDHLPAPLIV